MNSLAVSGSNESNPDDISYCGHQASTNSQ